VEDQTFTGFLIEIIWHKK